jgi:hypothetical protein
MQAIENQQEMTLNYHHTQFSQFLRKSRHQTRESKGEMARRERERDEWPTEASSLLLLKRCVASLQNLKR